MDYDDSNSKKYVQNYSLHASKQKESSAEVGSLTPLLKKSATWPKTKFPLMQMDSYTLMHQYWPSNNDLHTLSLCGHMMQSRNRPEAMEGTDDERESGTSCHQHNLMIYRQFVSEKSISFYNLIT